MKRIIFSIFVALLTLSVVAQQQAQAKVVLDKTKAVFEKAGGVKAGFSVQAFSKGRFMGESAGTIELKGEKFLLKTREATIWFDGTTQWTYLAESEEVNVSTPTVEDLQGMNPYALLSLYQKGFSYKLGATNAFRGKPVYEVILTPTTKKQALSRLVLYVTKEGYQPVTVIVESSNGNKSEINVTAYQAGLTYADALFVFNKKQYPHAEVIDLR